MQNGKTYYLNPSDESIEKYQVIPGIYKYKVWCINATSSTPLPLSLSKKQKSQYLQVLSALEKETPAERQNDMKKHITDEKIGIKKRKLKIIWQHRDKLDSNFYKMPGTNELNLDGNKMYEVKEIKELAIAAYKNNLNSKYFESTIVELANKDLTPILEFSNMSVSRIREIGVLNPGYEGDPQYFIIANEEGLSFRILRIYYPNAIGLRYCKNRQSYRIMPFDNHLELPPGIEMYNVLTDQVNEDSIDKKIEKYFQLPYTYKEICKLLLVNENVQISVLKRKLKKNNFKRKRMTETAVEHLVAALIVEVNSPGCNLGYRAHWLRLRKKYGFTVKQSTVLKLLRVIDPEGVEARARYRLKRRQYVVPGPNHIWHVDGMDKLKQFGFAISGCVDGFSRKVIWLEVSTTNNKTEVIDHYYLQAVLKQNCLPKIVRSDCGTENTLMEVFQRALRSKHDDEHAGAHSFIKGRSTANERIEKYWRQLRHQVTDFYINFFKAMVYRNLLDTSNPLHIECLRFCFGSLLQYELQCAAKEWNEQRVRKQNNIRAPCGIPNVIYYWPQRYGAYDCKKHVNTDDIKKLINQFTIKPKLYNPNTKRLLNILQPDLQTPRTVEEAFILFLNVIQTIQMINIEDDSQPF